MQQAYLEHANLTVSDPDAMAAILSKIFDWKVRWSGVAMDNGYSVHVGGKTSYLAIYTNGKVPKSSSNDFQTINNLNHLGVVVDDLTAIESKVLAAGYKPHNYGDYEPGSRFYFVTLDNLEIEVISYR